jgi:hypothetical protein
MQTLFEILGPKKVEEDVKEAEREVQGTLNAAGPFIRTGIERIDYLVDQVGFMKAGLDQATSRGLRGLSALEWAEYLSWPEACRQAGPMWRRELLHRYAFETPVAGWQGALHARSRDDTDLPIGPPRRVSSDGDAGIYPPPLLYLRPYPATWTPTKLAPMSLEAAIQFDPWTKPSPLAPVRRLNAAMSYTIQISGFRLYDARGALTALLIDEPREYSMTEARAELLTMAEQTDAWLERVNGEIPDARAARHRVAVDQLRSVASGLAGASSRTRADVLEAFFALPGTIWMTAPEVLPDDLPPEWLGLFVGFTLARKGLLSVRETKRLWHVAATVLESWQATRFPRYELRHDDAVQVVDKLATMRRLLGKESLFAYLAKAVPGVARDTRRREGSLIDRLRRVGGRGRRTSPSRSGD